MSAHPFPEFDLSWACAAASFVAFRLSSHIECAPTGFESTLSPTCTGVRSIGADESVDEHRDLLAVQQFVAPPTDVVHSLAC